MPDGFHSRAPGPGAGDMSPRTAALRPDIGLSDELVQAIRRLRKQGQEPDAIAATMAVPVSVVEQALLAMRTAKADRSRRTLNVTLGAAEIIHRERHEGEPVWEAVDRILDEWLALRQRGS